MTGLADSNPSYRQEARRLVERANWEQHQYTVAASDLITELADTVDALLAELDGYRRALVAHHELSTLSDEVIREYDFRECPVCQKARAEA